MRGALFLVCSMKWRQGYWAHFISFVEAVAWTRNLAVLLVLEQVTGPLCRQPKG